MVRLVNEDDMRLGQVDRGTPDCPAMHRPNRGYLHRLGQPMRKTRQQHAMLDAVRVQFPAALCNQLAAVREEEAMAAALDRPGDHRSSDDGLAAAGRHNQQNAPMTRRNGRADALDDLDLVVPQNGRAHGSFTSRRSSSVTFSQARQVRANTTRFASDRFAMRP